MFVHHIALFRGTALLLQRAIQLSGSAMIILYEQLASMLCICALYYVVVREQELITRADACVKPCVNPCVKPGVAQKHRLS